MRKYRLKLSYNFILQLRVNFKIILNNKSKEEEYDSKLNSVKLK